jgi:alanyl-tRNA synthetase
LYDTYGFPLDLTQLIAKENDHEVDIQGFEKQMAKQKERSRAAGATETSDWVVLRDNDHEEFIGYDTLTANVKITRYRKVVQQKKSDTIWCLI